MFYRIKENELYDRADYKFSDECLEFPELSQSEFNEKKDMFKVENGQLVDISKTKEYQNILSAKLKQKRKEEINNLLIVLDRKRVRAICEPSIKDDEVGQTWLEFYNEQVQTLREELITLAHEE